MVKKNLAAFLSILVFLGALFTFEGCKEETTTEPEKQSVVFLGWLGGYGSQGILMSDPIADPAQSQVKIKWDSQSRVFPEETVCPGYISFYDTTTLSTQKEYTIELTSNVGNCNGKVTIPGALSILQPGDEDTLSAYSNVYCEWSSATGASFYDLYYYADGYDYNGDWVGYCEDKDEFITSTSYTIPASYFNVSGAVYYDVSLGVSPYAGPPPNPGTSGNMSGDVSGFLTANGEGAYVWFYVGTPTKGKSEHRARRPTHKQRMNAYLEKLGFDKGIKK